ncbi:MAG: hypothetical protein EOO41_04300, partial [Methanobacteriota archaeon]
MVASSRRRRSSISSQLAASRLLEERDKHSDSKPVRESSLTAHAALGGQHSENNRSSDVESSVQAVGVDTTMPPPQLWQPPARKPLPRTTSKTASVSAVRGHGSTSTAAPARAPSRDARRGATTGVRAPAGSTSRAQPGSSVCGGTCESDGEREARFVRGVSSTSHPGGRQPNAPARYVSDSAAARVHMVRRHASPTHQLASSKAASLRPQQAVTAPGGGVDWDDSTRAYLWRAAQEHLFDVAPPHDAAASVHEEQAAAAIGEGGAGVVFPDMQPGEWAQHLRQYTEPRICASCCGSGRVRALGYDVSAPALARANDGMPGAYGAEAMCSACNACNASRSHADSMYDTTHTHHPHEVLAPAARDDVHDASVRSPAHSDVQPWTVVPRLHIGMRGRRG